MLSADRFDVFVYYDLRALEIITDTCLDILQAPRNILDHEIGERTLAVDLTMPFINALFRPFNDVVEIKW